MFASIFSLSILIALYAFAAQRKVSIIADESKGLSLSNPSSASVNYDIQCWDKNGTQKLSLTSQSLASKVTRKFGVSNCGNNSVPSVKGPSILGCYASNVSQYSTSCPIGTTVCTHPEILSAISGGVTSSSLNYYHFRSSTSLTHRSYDGGTNWQSTGSYGQYASNFNYMCNTSASLTGAIPNCYTVNYGGNVACCKTSSYAEDIATCDVIINSGGHLQSPNFKGGASF